LIPTDSVRADNNNPWLSCPPCSKAGSNIEPCANVNSSVNQHHDVVGQIIDAHFEELFSNLQEYLHAGIHEGTNNLTGFRAHGIDAAAENFFRWLSDPVPEQGKELHNALGQLDTHRKRLELYVQLAVESLAWDMFAESPESNKGIK
jgi:hypothetical protein